MSLQVWFSNDLNILAEKVKPKNINLFQTTAFVTQTTGLQHWLTLNITKRDGVFSNVDFYKPSDLIQSIGSLLKLPKTSACETENLRWNIYSLLERKDFEANFPEVVEYFLNDDLKRIQLATKVSDLFEQYFIYRTEMVKNWSITGFNKNKPYAWQQWLWIEIKKNLPEGSIDKVEFKEHFLKALLVKKNQEALVQKFPEIHIFGLSIIKKYHLEILQKISEVTSVHFYFLNPCPEIYWYDLHSEKTLIKMFQNSKIKKKFDNNSLGNTLLTSWGKVGQEMFSECFDIDDSFLNNCDSSVRSIEGTSLLKQVQSDILENKITEEREFITEALIKDGSILINSNYIEHREVEALYNFLVKTIENSKQKNEPLKTEDIVVMVPDIEIYIPYIRTVFDNAPVLIPYTIADEPISSSQSLMTFVFDVLNLSHDEFTSENVLKLLDYSFVAEQYNIKNLQGIRKTVKDCNIRFGLEGNKKSETHFVSWEQGLKKIIFGIAMRDNDFVSETETVYPYEQAEGSYVNDLLGLNTFMSELIKIVQKTKVDKTLKEWSEFVLEIIETFSKEKSTIEHENEFLELRKKVKRMLEIENEFGKMTLSLNVFIYVFQDSYKNEVHNEGYFRGKITFCTALPMRSIPFRIIAFLGLGADSFPRQNSTQAFDLMENGQRQRGDRNTKDNDKYLFLEALLSAKDTFYLSYLGKNAQNNKAKNPSILIDELVDYLSLKCSDTVNIEEALFIEHPLHGSSKKYLQNDERYYTYFGIKSITQNIISENENLIDNNTLSEDLSWTQIKRYYRNPTQWFFNNNLNIYYREENNTLSETEHFKIERGLEEYVLNNLLLEVPKKEIQEFILKQKQVGDIPLSNMGKVVVGKQYEDKVSKVQSKYIELTKGKPSELEPFSIKINNLTIAGEVSLFTNNLVAVSFSSEKRVGKTLFPLYLDFLIQRCLGVKFDAHLILSEKVYSFKHTSLTKTKAKEEVEKLLNFFQENQNKMWEFYPMLSYISIVKPKDYLKSLYGNYKVSGELDLNEYLAKSAELGCSWDFPTVEPLAKKIMQAMIDISEEEIL